MKRNTSYLLASFGMAALCSHASGFVSESFDYAPGNLEGMAAAGVGLTGNWTSGYLFSSGGFVPNGSSGNIVDGAYVAGGSTLNAFAALASPISTSANSTTYMSFNYQVAVAGNVATSYSQVGLTASNYANNADYFWFGKGSSNDTFAMKVGSGGVQASTVGIMADTNYLVILKFTNVVGGTDTVEFSVFADGIAPGTEPAVWNATITATLEDDFTFNGVAIRNGTAQTEFRVDNILMGDSYAVVVPEPSTYAAIIGLLALGIVALRRRRRVD